MEITTWQIFPPFWKLLPDTEPFAFALISENTTENDVTKFQALSNYAVWQTVHKTFVKMKYGPVYLFGVVAGNSTTNASWDLVKIYGGIDKSHYYKSNLRCCLAYKDAEYASFVKVNPDYVRRFQVPSAIWSIHVTCPNVRHAQNAVPVGVALTVDNYNCSKSDVRYVIPYFPLREAQQKVAIATKIAYGNISAEMIIEWMEWYRFIEVDKVVTFYIKSLNDKALKVLQYYASTGILDLYFYEPAALGESWTLNPLSELLFDEAPFALRRKLTYWRAENARGSNEFFNPFENNYCNTNNKTNDFPELKIKMILTYAFSNNFVKRWMAFRHYSPGGGPRGFSPLVYRWFLVYSNSILDFQSHKLPRAPPAQGALVPGQLLFWETLTASK